MPDHPITPPLAGERRVIGWMSAILVVIFTLFSLPLHAANPVKLGDLDGDGLLTVYDLTRLRGHIRQTAPLAANLVPFADVTGDGFVNEDDSVALIRTITGADTAKTLPLSSIRETSPFSGESNVSLTREVVVRFTTPLSLNSVLSTWNANTQTPGTLYAEGGGRKLLTRVELSGDHTKATLFFLEPIPASTRITVTFADTGLHDLLDRQIDPDGDGTPGGTVTFTYDTSPITPVPGTGIIGRVLASEKAPNGSDVPLAGALVRVVGSETLFTHTGPDGAFSLNPCPAGRFFVEVDGRTCPVSNFPDGGYYPYINKPWEALPGKTDNLAAGTGVIYLPLVAANTLKPVSASAETTVTFAPSAIAANPALAGVEIYVPPNSLFADDGTRGGKVGLAPVASDRLPEPLPPGLNHALDISIQTDGGTNFDQPVPVKFPNLPDPVTGIKLKPGEKSALWSYNHDKGRWEISGPMTVTDDGNFLVTDVGVGVRQPGWHGAMPGVDISLGESYGDLEPGSGTQYPPEEDPEKDPCDDQWETSWRHTALVAIANGMGRFPGTGTYAKEHLLHFLNDNGQSRSYGTGSGPAIDILEYPGFKQWFLEPFVTQLEKGVKNFIQAGASPIPDFGAVVGGTTFYTDVKYIPIDAVSHIYSQLASGIGGVRPFKVTVKNINFRTNGDYSADINYDIYDHYSFDDADIKIDDPDKWAKSLQDCGLAKPFDVYINFTQSVSGNAYQPKGNKQDAAADEAVFSDDGSDNNDAYLPVAFGSLHLPYPGLGGGQQFMIDSTGKHGIVSTSPNKNIGGTFFLVVDSDGAVIQRGKINNLDFFGGIILAPSKAYTISLVSRDGARSASALIVTPTSGQQITSPPFLFTIDKSGDLDGDGLADDVELVVGTDPTKLDTDNDGLSDGAEVKQGADPLSGLQVMIGLLSYIETPGQAKDIAAQNNIAILADGSEGVSVFNVSNALSPVRTAQVRLNGSIEAVALDGSFAAAAGASLSLLDLRDLSAVRVIKELSLGGSPACVTAAGGIAYAGLGTGQVVAVDMVTAVEIERLQISNEAITDVTFVGDVLYARTASRVSAIDLAAGGMKLAGSVSVNGSAGGGWRLRLNPGNGQLYAPNLQGYTIISLANPLTPVVQEVISTQQFGWKQIVPTGSGLGVAAMSGFGTDADISLYNIGADGTGSQFLTTFVTPGSTEAVSIYNGLAYVADGATGLTIVNYKAYDTLRVPPGVQIGTGFPVVNGALQAEEGKLGRISAIVTDDVQVRDVEFYVDDQRITTDGSFPFEHRFTTPLRSQAAAATAAAIAALDKLNSACCGGVRETNEAARLAEKAQAAAELPLKTSFTLRAKATDTGGNSTWSETLTVNLVADATAPRVVKLLPSDGSLTGKLKTFVALFSEPLDQSTVSPSTFVLTMAGTDGLFGTADDITPAGGVLSYRDASNSVFLTFPADLSPGLYQLSIRPPLADLAGNPIAMEKSAKIRIFSFSDRDGDGVPDDVEAILGLDPDNPDSDGDGIRDGEEDFDNDGLINTAEIFIGTDPTQGDTNNNGIPDGLEDADGDKLNNIREFLAGTDPNKADTDGDGWNDETEVSGGSNPLDPNSWPRGFIASSPSANLLRLGETTADLLGNRSVVSTPAVVVARLSFDPAGSNGSSGSASFIATPPVYLARSGSTQAGPYGSTGSASIAATPPVTISRFSTADSIGTAAASIIASPSVNTTRMDGAGAILSKPPVNIQTEAP